MKLKRNARKGIQYILTYLMVFLIFSSGLLPSMTSIVKAAGDMYSSQVPVYPFNGQNINTVFDKIGFYHLQAIGGSNVNGYDVSQDPKIKGRYIDADNDSSTFSSSSMEYKPNGVVEAAFLYISPNNIKSSTDPQPTFIQGPKGGKFLFDKSVHGVYDITEFVQQEGAGHYWGKNVWLQNPLSIPWGQDALANWDIVFVERNESLPPMMTKLNYYFGSRTDNPSTLSDQPFLTKQTGSLKGSMVASVYGGNQNIDNDQYRIIAYKNNQIVNNSFMSDSARAENNFWNGSITKNGQNIGTRNPNRTPANTDIFNYDFTSSSYFPAGIDRLDQVFTAEPVNAAGSTDGYSPHFWGVAIEVIPPKLEISKSVKNKLENKTFYEVGDTVVYSIVANNTVVETVAKNVTIEDEIPAGLELVEGTLRASHQAVPEYNNGKVTVNFGHVSDTDERTVTFEAKILDNQAGNSIKNVANVNSDGLDPVTAETDFTVNKNPLLESNKTVTIDGKAPGNLDAQHAEVGDTLLYTIETRNTIPDSLVKNLTVSDLVPNGLQYVPGSLTVDGVSVTDSEGDDSGHYVSGQVVGKFGNVSDTNWHSIQFKAVVQPGQAGKDIINIGSVAADNIDKPDRPREVVEVYPRNPQIVSEKFAANTNVSKATYEVGDSISYTIRVRGVVNDTYLENLTITDTLPAGLEYVPGSLTVDGKSVTDENDNDAGYFVTGEVYGSFGNVDDMTWHTLEFKAVIQEGQGGQTIENTARVEGGNIDQPGEPTEKFVVEPELPVVPPVEPPVEPPIDPPADPDPPVDPPVNPPVDPVDPPIDPVDPPVTPPVDPGNGGGGDVPRSPVVESEKVAKDLNGGNIELGDTIEYTIRARNTVSGSQVKSMVISDKLPAELEFVAGTLKVNGVSVTDSVDGDRGEYANGTAQGSFGTVTDNAWYTLEFQAKIIKGGHGDIIKNVGEVNGSNLNVPSRPSEEITINDPTSVDPAPVMESGKEAKDLNGGTIQVGDVIEYTIRTRNTTPNAVKNLEISDELPSELKYVAGSLKVDGQPVTDVQDTDKGSYVDGIISGQFGNITDTAWHTIVFRAEVITGKAGEKIRNTGEITGDNLVVPSHPYEDIIIGGGIGSNPGIPGDTHDGSSTDHPNNPGGEDSNTGSPDTGNSGGAGESDETDVAGESAVPGQSDTSNGLTNADSGDSRGAGNKLPDTATNMYSYMLVGCIMLLAGLFLMRRKKA